MNVLLKPVVSEKSLKDAGIGIATFQVALTSSKSVIKKAVEDLFKVHVVSVVTTLRKGKKKRAGRNRTMVVRPNAKIARVKLKKGEKIEFFEVGEQK